MANVIVIMGESGSGKTTSLRNLDPSTTYIVDSDKKGLSWRGWKRSYSAENKNYYVCDHPDKVLRVMEIVDKERTDVKVLVIDTINGIMIAQERREKDAKGYDKWADLAWVVYDMFDYALVMRDDLTVIFVAHSQTDSNDNGLMMTHIKTSGRKLEKIVLESKVRTVLIAKYANGRNVFATRDHMSTCKTPPGLYDDEFIDNDVATVIADIEKYDQGE